MALHKHIMCYVSLDEFYVQKEVRNTFDGKKKKPIIKNNIMNYFRTVPVPGTLCGHIHTMIVKSEWACIRIT